MTTLDIPIEAIQLAEEAVIEFDVVHKPDACDIANDAITAAAPLIVAARLEQLADEIWQEHGADNETDADYVTGVDDAVVMMRAEVRRLRGEQS